MKIFRKGSDGGDNSGVTGYYIIEIKPLFSIVLLRFAKGSREAYHSHAFNAVTYWIKGAVIEHHRSLYGRVFTGGVWKITRRNTFHKVEALCTSWALTFRGPWAKTWQEDRQGHLVTLTNGRKIISEGG